MNDGGADELSCLLEESTRGSTPVRRSFCKRLCGRPPHDVDISEAGWIATSALSLAENGLVALRSAPSAPYPIPLPVIERCRCEARPLLNRYLDLADKSGAVADGAAIKFCELYSRAPRENRFDLAVLQRSSFRCSQFRSLAHLHGPRLVVLLAGGCFTSATTAGVLSTTTQ